MCAMTVSALTRAFSWLWQNRTIAAIIAAALLIASGSVGDGCRARSMANDYLKLARGWYAKSQADEAAWKKKDQAYNDNITTLKQAMTKARVGKPWRAPKDAEETAAEFRRLGYPAEVRR